MRTSREELIKRGVLKDVDYPGEAPVAEEDQGQDGVDGQPATGRYNVQMQERIMYM